MCGLVLITLFLQQRRILAVGARLRAFPAHPRHIQHGRVLAPHEFHKVGCRKQDMAVNFAQ